MIFFVFILGHNLFEEKSYRTINITNVYADFVADETLEDRAGVIDIGGSLKLSVIADLISVS